MSSAQDELRILKVDTRGRVQMPPEKQEWILDEFERSGMSGIAFAGLIYTIIESCRRRGIDPLAYLREVLNQLPTMTNRQIPTLTPEAWHKTRLRPAA